MNLLEITNLSVRFSALSDDIAALNSISLQLRPGEVLGIVGESGAGKSTLGLAILGLLEPPGRIVSGSIKLKGRELLSLHPTEMGKIRGRSIGAIFQDSYSALDPVLSIGWQIDETISFLLGLSGTEARTRHAV